MLSELKAFLLRGDVLALSIAVIIGGAFQKIVDSMVNDVISPLLAMIIGQPDFPGVMLGNIKVGNLITAVVNFILIGTVLFMLVKAAGKKPE
ncbi:MAG: large conductance mechanosensitive channel protein MscL [Bacteroidota bacterium]